MVAVSLQPEDSVAAFYSKIARVKCLAMKTVPEVALIKPAAELRPEALWEVKSDF